MGDVRIVVLSAGGGQTGPTPLFSDLLITRGLETGEFGSVHSKALTELFTEPRIAKELGGFESAIARVPECRIPGLSASTASGNAGPRAI